MTLVVAAAAMVVVSVVGGATGFATSLLSTPTLLLLGFAVPQVVVVNLAATMVSRIAVVIATRRLIDRRRVGLLVAGSAPGAVAGAFTVGYLDQQLLKTVTGIAVAAIGLYLLLYRPRRARVPGPPSYAVVGAVSGYLSTSISLNGPPVAVLLSRAGLTPARFVADFAGYFLATNSISLLVLGLHGRIPPSVLWPTVPLLCFAALAGNQLGSRLNGVLPQQGFQVVVTCLVVVSGVVTVLT